MEMLGRQLDKARVSARDMEQSNSPLVIKRMKSCILDEKAPEFHQRDYLGWGGFLSEANKSPKQ